MKEFLQMCSEANRKYWNSLRQDEELLAELIEQAPEDVQAKEYDMGVQR